MATPVSIALAAVTDTAGAATINVPSPPTQFAVMTLAAQCAGAPNWAVTSSSLPVSYGNGSQVSLGPMLTRPGELLTITVSGAAPRAQIVGNLSGTQHPTAEEAAATYKPVPNPVTLQTQQGQFVIGTIDTVGNGDTVTKTFPVPAGALGIQFIAHNTPFFLPSQVQVVGDVTGDTYLLDTQSANPFGADMGRWIPPDQNAVCSVTSQAGPGMPARVTFVALSFSPTFNVRNSGNAPLLTRENSIPRAWQAASANAPVSIASVASGGTQTLIAAASGVTLYLHGYSFSQDNANAAALWELQDSDGNVISSWFDTNVRKVFASGDFRGFPVTIGKGVRMLNGGAVASFLGGFLSYSTG
jgi:hypothetical protein